VPDRVTFTRPAAERIGKVVRIVEAGDRDASAWSVPQPRDSSEGSRVRMAYYTATSNWTPISFIRSTATPTSTGWRVIQFAFPTESTATAYCVNHFATLPLRTTVATSTFAVVLVSVVKDAGSWRLIAAEC
jgi:hypothetical protein